MAANANENNNIAAAISNPLPAQHLHSCQHSRQQTQQQLLDWLILFLCPFSIAIDIANGHFMLSGSALPLSVIFKSGLLLLLFVRLAITDLRITTGLLVLLLFFTLPAWRLFLLRGDFSLFFNDLSLAIRLLFFLSFLSYIVITRPPPEKIALIVKVLAITLALNLLVGLAGFGFPTYSADEGFGVKGFIYSGNELAITLVALSYFVLFHWVKEKIWLIKMIAVMAVIACGVLVATKSAMLGTLAIAGVFLFLHARKTLLFSFLALIALAIVFASEIYQLIQVSGIIDRFLFVYNRRGLLALIFSGREQFFLINSQFVLENFGLFGWVFGWGLGSFEGFVKAYIEIDFLDLFFAFGTAGLVSFVLYFYLIYRVLNIKQQFWHLAPLAMWVLTFAISFFAGHVVYSGVAAIPLTLALYACAASTKEPEASPAQR